jgi:transposase-like protein
MGRPSRRTFTPAAEVRDRDAALGGEKQLTALAREHGVDRTTIYRWRNQMQAVALEALDGKRQPRNQGPGRGSASSSGRWGARRSSWRAT